MKKTNVYAYGELSETAKEQAVNSLFDINAGYQWWELTCEQFENVGINVKACSDYRAEIELLDMAERVASNIVKNYDQSADIYDTATYFLQTYHDLELNDYGDDNDALEYDFIRSLAEDVRITMDKEYQYLTSEAFVVETIVANDYEFTKLGDVFDGREVNHG